MTRASRAQSNEVWPEVDTYLKTSSNTRASLFIETSNEDGERNGVEVNPNFDIFFKPVFEKLKRFAVFRVDEAKSRPLDFQVGYVYLNSPNGPEQNRLEFALTPRVALVSGFVVEDRNRGELQWINGQFSTRYRNRLTIEHTVNISGYHPTPYGSAELYYDTRYDKINKTQLKAGFDFPIKKSASFELYYAHTNDTSTPPNNQTNAVGLKLSLYFPWKK